MDTPPLSGSSSHKHYQRVTRQSSFSGMHRPENLLGVHSEPNCDATLTHSTSLPPKQQLGHSDSIAGQSLQGLLHKSWASPPFGETSPPGTSRQVSLPGQLPVATSGQYDVSARNRASATVPQYHAHEACHTGEHTSPKGHHLVS